MPAFAGDLDADGTMDLGLWMLHPMGPDGLRAELFGTEIYLGLGD